MQLIIIIILMIIVFFAAMSLLRFLLPFIILLGLFYFISRVITGNFRSGRPGNPFNGRDTYDRNTTGNDTGADYKREVKHEENPLDERPLSVMDEDFFEKEHEVVDVSYTDEEDDNRSGN